MKTKKILAWLTLWVFALSSFPANIFANNNLTDIEKKICEIHNNDYINNNYDYFIYENNFYHYEDDQNFKNFEKIDGWKYDEDYYSFKQNKYKQLEEGEREYDDNYIDKKTGTLGKLKFHRKYHKKDENLGNYDDNIIYDSFTIEYNWKNTKIDGDYDYTILDKIWDDYYYMIHDNYDNYDNYDVNKNNNRKMFFYKNDTKIWEFSGYFRLLKFSDINLLDRHVIDIFSYKFYWQDIYFTAIPNNRDKNDEDFVKYGLYKVSNWKIENILYAYEPTIINPYGHMLGDYDWKTAFFSLNNDIYFRYIYEIGTLRGPSGSEVKYNYWILKNWKPLCENLETQTPPNPPKDTKIPTNWNQNSENNTAGSAPSSIKSNEPIQKDKRVSTDTKELENNKKEDKKTENPTKTPEKKVSTNSSLSENEKNIIKKSIDSIFEKYSKNKSFLEKIYKVLTSREDILEMAEKNPRIKFVIEDFKEKFLRFKVKNF